MKKQKCSKCNEPSFALVDGFCSSCAITMVHDTHAARSGALSQRHPPTVTPPPGNRLLRDDERGLPLPEGAKIWIGKHLKAWDPHNVAGSIPLSCAIYAVPITGPLNPPSAPKQGMALVKLAESIARDAHAGQFRRDGTTPYIVHPGRVVARLDDESHIERAVAWLHDVIEDTSVSHEDLAGHGIPDAVLEALDTLTKKPGQDYEAYIQGVCMNEYARPVKIADILDNLNDTPSEAQVKKYTKALEAILRYDRVSLRDENTRLAADCAVMRGLLEELVLEHSEAISGKKDDEIWRAIEGRPGASLIALQAEHNKALAKLSDLRAELAELRGGKIEHEKGAE